MCNSAMELTYRITDLTYEEKLEKLRLVTVKNMNQRGHDRKFQTLTQFE